SGLGSHARDQRDLGGPGAPVRQRSAADLQPAVCRRGGDAGRILSGAACRTALADGGDPPQLSAATPIGDQLIFFAAGRINSHIPLPQADGSAVAVWCLNSCPTPFR